VTLAASDDLEPSTPLTVSTPELAPELSTSSVELSTSVETPRSLVIPLDSIIPQYPDGLEVVLTLPKADKPVGSSDVLSKKKGYYIVPWAGEFHYHKVADLKERSEHIWEFTKKPLTKKEGLMVINKEIYHITVDDLKRGIVRKSRKVTIKTGSTYDDLLNPAPTTAAKRIRSSGSGSGNSNKSADQIKQVDDIISAAIRFDTGLSSDFGVELNKEIDLAIEEQERSLYDLISEEAGEDWIIEEAT
jgi:hypothetical protein